MTVRTGRCLCGAAAYRLTGEPITFYACHCTDCQRRGGAAFGLSLLMSKSAVELVKGKTEQREAAVENGRVKRHMVCPACATQLWGISGRNPDVLVIRPGTLDDQSGLEPVAHIWTSSKRPWVTIPAGAAAFDRQPEDPTVLARLWKERR